MYFSIIVIMYTIIWHVSPSSTAGVELGEVAFIWLVSIHLLVKIAFPEMKKKDTEERGSDY